jgi:hypothetical protein
MEAWRRSSKECADQVVREIKKSGGMSAVALKLDLSKQSTFGSFAQEVKSSLKSVCNRMTGRDPM